LSFLKKEGVDIGTRQPTKNSVKRQRAKLEPEEEKEIEGGLREKKEK